MHEINAAAETITTAADPEANIIFGATVSPDLDGEVIITVVATGFDASYYAKQRGNRSATPALSSTNATKSDEKALSEIDMNLDEDTPEFHKENTMPNIWALDDDEDKKDKEEEVKPAPTDDDDHETEDHSVVTGSLEDDLEKPSFLRRLGRRRKGADQDSDSEDAAE
jgi:hypothetical protein